MKKIHALILFAITLLNSCNFISEDPQITTDELYHHIEFLASDSLKGRYPGSPEDIVTAQYIAKQFNKAGFELLYDNGLQKFEVSNSLLLGDNNSLYINDNKYEINKDYIPISFSDNNKISEEIVFVGYGFNIHMQGIEWNDYKNTDIKNKWVLILRGEPDVKNSKIPFGMFSSLRSKATTAKDLGAAGVLFVSGNNFAKNDGLIELDRPEGNINIPVLHIKRDVADEILKGSGKSLKSFEEKGKNISFLTKATANAKIEVLKDIKTTYNIAAKLTTDEKNPNYIVIGAHYDHLGFGGAGSGSRAPNENKPHYGADDNASGVAAVIEIAEKLNSVKENLKTNFIIAAFGAEEMGLLGSKHFTNNLPVNDSVISAMINIDMVGRLKPDNSLQVSGTGTSIEGETLLNDLNSSYKFSLGFSREGYGPSDHSSFYTKDIPVFFYSTGAHMDYHTPGDSLGAINFEGLEKVSNYIYDMAYELSSKNIDLTFQEAGPKIPKQQGRTRLKVTLGIMPDFSGVVKNGLRADIVVEGKPAYKAGMESGDIITAIDGNSVSDVYEYMERLSKLKVGQIITVEVIRKEQKEVLIVQL